MRKLAPSVSHKNEIVPVYLAYASVMDVLDPERYKSKNEDLRKSMMEFRKQIFRNSRVKETISDWDEMAFWEHYELSPSQWEELDIHDRAKMKARLILSNMVEVVDRYHEVMEEKRKKGNNDKALS